jgi:hypothetical protein
MAYIDNGTASFLAGEALAIHRLVRLDGSTTRQIVYCDAGETPLGSTLSACKSGEMVSVKLLNAEGTVPLTVSAAVAAHSKLVPTNDGKVDDTGGSPQIAIAARAATADGEQIEGIPLPVMVGSRESVATATGTQTLTIASARHQFIDPQGNVNVDLPAEASSAGLSFYIYNTADAAETITVRDDGAATVATVAQDEAALVTCNGTVWRSLVGPNT